MSSYDLRGSPDADDLALLERLRQGDEVAFDTIFRRLYAQLVQQADRLLHDIAAAEEVVQDVMLELWRRREQLAPRGSAHAYLITATRNRALNHLRNQRVRAKGEPFLHADVTTSSGHTDAGAVESEIDAALRLAIADLPPRCREVFQLSRVQGLKYSEIAETLEISVKAVEAQMGKALRILRDRLSPWLPGGTTL